MNSILILYMLKVALIIVLFYAAYRTLFRRIGFFQVNRFYLLYTTLIAFLIPLLQFSWSSEDSITIVPKIQQTIEPVRQYFINQTIPINRLEIESAIPEAKTGWQWSWSLLLTLIYLVGVLTSLILFISKIFKLRKIVIASEREEHLGQTILRTNGLSISSFFNYIFWQNPPDEKHRDWVIQHERVHMYQWHSMDNILLELVRMVQWFNPAIYFIIRDLKLIHEYIADRATVRHVDKIEYGQLLVDQQVLPHAPLGSTFHSFIKERLQMLGSYPTARWKLTFYLLTIPLLILSSLLFSSWIFKDSEEWEKQLDQVHFSDAEGEIIPISFEWGNLKREIKPIHFVKTNGYGRPYDLIEYMYYEKVSKFKITELFEKPFLIKGPLGASFDFEKIEVISNNEAVPQLKNSIYLGTSNYLDSSLQGMINTSENNILHFSSYINGIPMHISFHLLDFEDKSLYLKWGDLQFDIERGPGFQSIQEVNWETMAQLLQRRYEIIQDKESFSGQHGTLMIKNGTTTIIDPSTLAKKIEMERQIKDPIILQITGKDGIPYVAVFDDEPNPTLHFDTWDELCYDHHILLGAKLTVGEPQWQLNWGPLVSTRPPTSFGNMLPGAHYFKFKTSFGGDDFYAGQAFKTEIVRMLTAGAILSEQNGRTFPNIEIVIDHIKSQGVPKGYQFGYKKGRITDNSSLGILIGNLESGDFLDIKKIAPLGHTKSIHLYFKVL